MKKILIISFPRSGTHLLLDTINNNFFNLPYKEYISLDDELNMAAVNGIKIEVPDILNNTKSVFIKSHIRSDLLQYWPLISAESYNFDMSTLITNCHTFYISRNIKDVMVSLFHYFKYVSDKIELPFDEFIKNINTCYGESRNNLMISCNEHVNQWMALCRDINFITYEQIMEDYENILKMISSIINLPISNIIKDVRKINGNVRSGDAYYSHVVYRKGVIGDYKNYIFE